jgi:Ca-activated chloride channel family protein
MRLFFLLLMSAAAAAAQGVPTFSVDVPLVSVDVMVTDADGKPMNTLTKDDFLIYEEGVLQEIQNFSAVDVPYNVLLLFDCSGSAKPQKELMSAAMMRLLNNLRPQDTIAIAEFGEGVDLRVDWRPRNDGAINVGLGTFAGCNNTDFYGAIAWAARKLQGVSGRKGVIVYSDGMAQMPLRPMAVGGRGVHRPADSQDDPGFQSLLQTVRASATSFYFVAIDTDVNPRTGTPPAGIYALQQARARMEQLAEVSGGRVAFPLKPDDILPMYERVGRELGTSYSLGYVSTNSGKDGRFRPIIVRLRDDGARIRQSREGYVAP